jgi:single-strand DNA-binding protein
MYQQITLIGNLGSDPEMRYTPSGVPVATFSLAVNRRWTGQDGQKQEKTTWFRITSWRKQAEIVSQYLTKGSKVLIVGEIEEARPWTDKDGNTRVSLEVTAQNVQFLSGKGETSGGGNYASEPAGMGASGGANSGNRGGEDLSDEEIPF